MKKPTYQSFTENAVTILFSIGSIASIINGISNATGLMGYRTAATLLFIVSMTWILLEHLVKKGKIKWVVTGGHTVKFKKLGRKTDLYFLGICLILVAHMGFDFYKNGPFSSNAQKERRIVFKPDAPFLKLLILPWQKECSINGKSYDIGLVLKNRLDDMVTKDSIRLLTLYADDSTDYRNFNKDDFNHLMRYYNADMVIHGFYSFSECEGGSFDKVCYMYQTNFKRMGIESMSVNETYSMHDMHGLEDIREGAGQESIDFIIHWVAAMSEMRNKDFAKAIRMFQRIKGYENNQDILFNLSNCYYSMGDRSNFKAMLEKVLQINPHHQEAIIHMSIVLMGEGKADVAKSRLEKIQAIEPHNISVLRDLCLVYRELKDTVRSHMYYQRFITEVPECDSNYKILGAFYKDVKNYPKSKECYEKAFRLCSKHVGDCTDMGCAYLLLGDSVKAKPYFKAALERDTNSVTALTNMGILLYREKDYVKAGEYLQKAEKIGPVSTEMLLALGNNYEALQQKGQAVTYFERVLAFNPNIVSVLVKAAVLYMQLKRNEDANKYLDRLVSYYPDNIQILNSIAYLCADKENYSQAEIYYKRLLKLAPRNPAVLYNLASMAGCQNNKGQAMEFLSRALAMEPSLKKTAKKDKAFECIRAEKEFNAITN